MTRVVTHTCDGPGCEEKTTKEVRGLFGGWIVVEYPETDTPFDMVVGHGLREHRRLAYFHDEACFFEWSAQWQRDSYRIRPKAAQ